MCQRRFDQTPGAAVGVPAAGGGRYRHFMRPQPAIHDIAYSFQCAVAADAFIQFPLLTADRFGREAKKRGADLSFGSVLRERLEALDEAGALCPALFDVRQGTPVLREEQDFVPWAEYAVDEDGVKQPHPYYAYWQLLYIADAIELGQAPASLDWDPRG